MIFSLWNFFSLVCRGVFISLNFKSSIICNRSSSELLCWCIKGGDQEILNPQVSFLSGFESGFKYTPSQWGNYHHSMFKNPTAAVNLFHVGKQYLTFCKAEAAVTHNLIGRTESFPTSNTLKHVTRPTFQFRRHTRIYMLGAPSHFPTEYRHEAAVVSWEHIGLQLVVIGRLLSMTTAMGV